jgi:hypothetical protein
MPANYTIVSHGLSTLNWFPLARWSQGFDAAKGRQVDALLRDI